jgi:transglutaminase-like putative cysteine protease
MTLAGDCGGLSLLFVAIMRTNEVPARTLFGRWAILQTDSYGQYHVMAEFFVSKSGWVPGDVSGTVVHRPLALGALFRNADGQFLAFHIDPDLGPATGFRHA